MWHFISEQISNQVDQPFICDDIRQIGEGDSHKAYRVCDGKKRYFVKLNHKSKLPMFETEAEGLKHLASSECIRIPKVICSGAVSDKSFLVLEFIHLNEGNQDNWYQLGEQLAKLHESQSQQMYGWQEDNFIGQTPQTNRWHKRWSSFFAEQRIGFMLQLLAEKQLLNTNIDRVVNQVETLLAGHQPAASILHGDLWTGNVGFFHEQPVIFDPAFYFGDRETDIAMTELFGPFPNSFYQGYQSKWPLDADYQYRKSIYQLYHTLNHALLFKGHYVESAKQTLKNLEG